METEIKKFILAALKRANDVPLPDGTLRQCVRGAFPHVSLTTDELGDIITALDEALLIAGTTDELTGRVWLLTPKGKIRAQKL